MKVAGRRKVLEAVAGNLKRYHMLPDGARAGVAVSGGADSVCLLDVLATLAPAHGWTLAVLHLDHGWRGEQSREDARFVEQLAERYGLQCVVGQAADYAPAKPGGSSNLEQQGREARRAFFAAQRAALGLDRIATGHTLDDQAETVLFRLLRGTGPGGLAGILPVTAEGIVRPLLSVGRPDIGQWLKTRGLAWREDPSNADTRFRRNALRAVLPELCRLVNPAARLALARLAEVACEEEKYWAGVVEESGAATLEPQQEGGHCVVVDVDKLLALPPALARRVLRRALEHVRGGLNALEYHHVESVLALARQPRGEGRRTLPGAFVERSFHWLRIAAAPTEPLPESAAGEGVVLRGWRPGDRFDGRPFRDYLQRKKVPRWQRTRWRVLARGSTLLWAAGPGLSETGRREGCPPYISPSEMPNVSI
jgi:tRNA(Ile)-lysidine synthase